MRKLFAFICLLPIIGIAQINSASLSKVVVMQPVLIASPVQPVDASELNYDQIMFEYPYVNGAAFYRVEISEIRTTVSKDTVLVREITDSTNATLVSDLGFGKQFCWRYTAFRSKHKKLFTSQYYSFSTLKLPQDLRVRVAHSDYAKGEGGLVTFDYSGMIVDRTGKPVWFLRSQINGAYTREDRVRDLRVTSAGTITFLTEKSIFETAPDGRILWSPLIFQQNSVNPFEYFHHDLHRLPNGDMMTIGNKTMYRSMPGDTTRFKLEYGVIVEYDRMGKLKWQWNSSHYVSEDDLFHGKQINGKPDVSMHMNAITPDDSGEFVFAGFRDLDRIVKIEKRSGKVIASYGRKYSAGEARTGNVFFQAQHDVCVLRNGNIAVFNNDSVADPQRYSSVVIFSQITGTDSVSKIVWSYSLHTDQLTDGKSLKGGSIDELANGNLLIDMGTIDRTIELTMEKRIIWDAFTESWSAEKNQWIPLSQYRSHFVSSLYPCYFTSHIQIQRSKSGSEVTEVVISNEGTESDSYVIRYRDADDSWKQLEVTSVLMPGRSIHIALPASVKGSAREVRISSTRNTDFVRNLSL